jgi:hypothetical protein
VPQYEVVDLVNTQQFCFCFLVQRLLQIITDYDYFAPTYKEMLLHQRGKGKAAYLYRFSFRSSNRLLPEWMGKLS